MANLEWKKKHEGACKVIKILRRPEYLDFMVDNMYSGSYSE